MKIAILLIIDYMLMIVILKWRFLNEALLQDLKAQ